MYFLAIETSCDETSAAVFREDLAILSNVVASQTDLHSHFGGVVPEIAARAHLRNILPVIEEALSQAMITLADVCCVAVHHTPGLVGALLIGVTAAKSLALAVGVPLIAVNHVAAHIFACQVAHASEGSIFPCVGLVVSGGHTSLFHCHSALNLELLGGTRDDAAGEAFDKVATLLGLGFPGGPALEREAALGNPKAHSFPRAFIHDDSLDFSFSGLKTSVLYALHGVGVAKGPPPGPGPRRADLAAGFQSAVVEVLAAKCRKAMHKTGLMRLAVGGGVTANKTLRDALEVMVAREGAKLYIPPMSLCTDNAAMAALAVEKYKVGDFAELDLDAEPHAPFGKFTPPGR